MSHTQTLQNVGKEVGTMNNLRANATEINKTPFKVRLVFLILVRKDPDDLRVITTARTLSEYVDKPWEGIKVLDIKYSTISRINPTMLSELVDEWRDNYRDPEWTVPMGFCLD